MIYKSDIDPLFTHWISGECVGTETLHLGLLSLYIYMTVTNE